MFVDVQAPEEFKYALMDTVISDPVILPTLGHVVDRSTIIHHLLRLERERERKEEVREIFTCLYIVLHTHTHTHTYT